jgi:cell wall-associated NlpC family hydrolase
MTIEEAALRASICAEAESWIPTPYHDHAGVKGVGCDCAFYPCAVYKAVGLISKELKLPRYSPQQWLNNKSQRDKQHLRFEDTTYLDIVLSLFREIPLAEVLPGDLMLTKVVASWSHGAIIIRYPERVLHSVKGFGVVASHATQEGFWQREPKRFFTIVRKNG